MVRGIGRGHPHHVLEILNGAGHPGDIGRTAELVRSLVGGVRLLGQNLRHLGAHGGQDVGPAIGAGPRAAGGDIVIGQRLGHIGRDEAGQIAGPAQILERQKPQIGPVHHAVFHEVDEVVVDRRGHRPPPRGLRQQRRADQHAGPLIGQVVRLRHQGLDPLGQVMRDGRGQMPDIGRRKGHIVDRAVNLQRLGGVHDDHPAPAARSTARPPGRPRSSSTTPRGSCRTAPAACRETAWWPSARYRACGADRDGRRSRRGS
jgi:hypothetical protein